MTFAFELSSTSTPNSARSYTRPSKSPLSKLTYTPPTPPRPATPFVQPIHPTPKVAAVKKEVKQRKKVVRMRIRKLDDGRRVTMTWLPKQGVVKPYNYTLLSLEEAQRRKDIVYRNFLRA